MSGLKNLNKNRSIIVVGKNREEKLKKAYSFVSEDAILQYANEYDLEDNFSISSESGIIIEEVDYKPNVDLVKKTMLEYRGQVVLLSSNQKDVPKSLFNLCILKRATKNNIDEHLEKVAPNSDDRDSYDVDIFPMVRNYLMNSDRERIATILKINKTPDVQLLTWLAPNIHPNKISFVDFVVKRKWDSDYFYEMLAYSHDGKIHRKMEMPKRGSYSKVPRLLRKIGLKPQDVYLFNSLKEDEELRNFMKTKLTHEECRLLKLGEKRRRKKYDPVVQPPSLSRWL
tara:strand:+ start:520 stop:1371 length:852 start_codon:yes stop_codon:yes gene_type:complete